ncbi:MAG: hypothetical protein KKC68_01720 [Candidatus Thermoplasmatota archaeon]|nr:hypothetical protein [Candidatus Thermoplasmatota archaeon]MBU1940467.1 hypothetical protein [Candidatus Thermoplasmatota archaeon]
MKARIVCILISMLLITSGTLVLADWEPGDGHKMHFPQLPNPFGWDVDFHDWWLADDWECSEDGPVEDIHFWISYQEGFEVDIPFIDISIWSNNPGPPSHPEQMMWQYIFQPGEFIFNGPWDGVQGWYWPPDYYRENDHFTYWQINIPDIPDPFIQEAGTIYWLVISMPFYVNPFAPPGVGWKTSLDHFMDAAVFGYPGNWVPIHDPINGEQIDFAFVITGETPPPPYCCVNITAINGGFLDAVKTPTVNADITNMGTGTCVNVSWSFAFSGLIFLGPASGVIPSMAPGATVTVSSKPVLGFAFPGIFPGQVTITADAENNACPPATITREIQVLLLLCKVI